MQYKIVFVKFPYDEDYDAYGNVYKHAPARKIHPAIVIENKQKIYDIEGVNYIQIASTLMLGTSSPLDILLSPKYIEIKKDTINLLDKDKTFFKYDPKNVIVLPRTERFFEVKDLPENREKYKNYSKPTLSKKDSYQIDNIIQTTQFKLLLEDLKDIKTGRVFNWLDNKYK